MHTEFKYMTRPHWGRELHRMMGAIDHISTMSTSRVHANIEAIRHVAEHDIRGDIAEFGVYMGGNLALFAHELHTRGLKRQVWAYDTFEGVPYVEIEPMDVVSIGDDAFVPSPVLRYVDSKWCFCDIDTVRSNVNAALKDLLGNGFNTAYLMDNIKYIVGTVMTTVPAWLPEAFSFVRLDMDIAQPTRHVMDHVWDRLSVGGIIHVDDYNTFSGVNKVVNDFLLGKSAYVNEIDYTAIAIVRYA